MSVADGQKANATNFNAAFVSRTTNSDTIGKITLNNTSDINSGAQVTNVQRAVNETFDTLGIASEGDTNRKVYSSNNVVANGDDRKVAIGKLDAEFDTSTGHDHDGNNSTPISASNLADLNYFRADWQEITVTGASGGSVNVTTQMSGKTPGGNSTTAGVATTAPNNRSEIRDASTFTYIEDAGGQRVYGRITESSGTWTLTFYTNEAGVETAHTLASADIKVAFKEVFTLETLPTFGADTGVLGSFDLTADILDATETVAGKVLLADQVATSVGASNVKGTSTAVAREDHAHEGVHSLDFMGGGAPLKGDVELEPGSGINMSYSGGRIKIDSTAAATAPNVQVFTSGSGTYTTPASTVYLRVRLVGAGGGGAGSGTGAGAGGAGGNTEFGTAFLTGAGGNGGTVAGGSYAPGGTATGGDINIEGGPAQGPTGGDQSPGPGGGSVFGGHGNAGAAGQPGGPAAPNSGSGGGGGGYGGVGVSGGGGSAGGYVEKYISSPSASYSYTVGTGGASGSAGTGGFIGGLGADGIIIVEAHF